jgi:histidyl-tRNA synthetase
MELRAPRGMQDILPDETGRWQRVEAQMRALAGAYGYREIRTPILEHTEVFQRGVGAGTDIVDKEMYTFTDRGGRSVTLRAEGTAPVMRAVLEHNLAASGLPIRVYYICPIFRYDRPQAGRYRQHTQFGAEVMGSPEPAADAEVLSLAVRLVEKLGLQKFKVHLSSVGDEVCRPHYIEALRNYYRPRLADLCEDCQRRFETAPMRLLDCKRERDRVVAAEAPRILDYLCDPCRKHFEGVQACLRAMEISYVVDPLIVRGLDYYTRTAFEAMSDALGAQNVVFGGGRYDGLAKQLGGKPMPGVGFGMGIERLLLVLDAEGKLSSPTTGVDVFVAAVPANTPAITERHRVLAISVSDRLRRRGIVATSDVIDRSLTAQMKVANRLGASFAVILGETGIALRNMARSRDEELPLRPEQTQAILGLQSRALDEFAELVLDHIRAARVAR